MSGHTATVFLPSSRPFGNRMRAGFHAERWPYQSVFSLCYLWLSSAFHPKKSYHFKLNIKFITSLTIQHYPLLIIGWTYYLLWFFRCRHPVVKTTTKNTHLGIFSFALEVQRSRLIVESEKTLYYRLGHLTSENSISCFSRSGPQRWKNTHA